MFVEFVEDTVLHSTYMCMYVNSCMYVQYVLATEKNYLKFFETVYSFFDFFLSMFFVATNNTTNAPPTTTIRTRPTTTMATPFVLDAKGSLKVDEW